MTFIRMGGPQAFDHSAVNSCQQAGVGLSEFPRRLSRRTAIKRPERKGRRSFDTAIERGTVAIIAPEKTQTRKIGGPRCTASQPAKSSPDTAARQSRVGGGWRRLRSLESAISRGDQGGGRGVCSQPSAKGAFGRSQTLKNNVCANPPDTAARQSRAGSGWRRLGSLESAISRRDQGGGRGISSQRSAKGAFGRSQTSKNNVCASPPNGPSPGEVERIKRVQGPRSWKSARGVIPAKAGVRFALGWTPAFAGVTTTFVALGGAKGACPVS